MSRLDLDAIFAAFREAALGELDRSPATIVAYRTAWDDYRAFVPESATLEDMAAAAVAYRTELRQRRLAASTIHNRLAAIKSVFKWADSERLLVEDPLRRFRLPRTSRNPRSAIDREGYEALLGRLPALAPVPRLIIGLAAYAGLRAGEIRSLNVEDVDLEARQLTVRQGKGGKDRHVFLHPDLARLIGTTWAETQADGYSAKERIEHLCQRDYVSIRVAARRLGLGEQRLYRISRGSGLHERVAGILAKWDGEWSIDRWMTVAGSHGLGLGREHGQPLIAGQGRGGRVAKNRVWYTIRREIEACPHQFRTTWVTVLLEAGIPLQVVADEAGHIDLETTRGYIGRRDEGSRERLAEVSFTGHKDEPPVQMPESPFLQVLPAGAPDLPEAVASLWWVPEAVSTGHRNWLLPDGTFVSGWQGMADYLHAQLDAGVNPNWFSEWAWDHESEKEPVIETLANLTVFADYMAARLPQGWE